MALKNRKHNYPLYETTVIPDIRTMVENSGERFTDRVAFEFRRVPTEKESEKMTYGECRDAVRALGTELLSLGLSRKTVALIGEISPEWCISYFSVLGCGAVVVPVDKELPPADITGILNTAEVEALLFAPSVAKKMDEVVPAVPTLKCVYDFAEETPAYARPLSEALAAGADKLAAGETSYADAVIDVDAVASIVFTSGTTGKGKGVMLSQRNICSDMQQGIYNFLVTDRTMFVLPPHHTFGSTVNLIGHYAQGVTLYLSSGIRYVMNELKSFRPTSLILVPLFVETFYKRITSTAEKSGKLALLKRMIKLSDALRKVGIDLRAKLFASVLENFGGRLSQIICGGAALNQEIIDFFESIGVTIMNGYGITECAPLISANRNEYRKRGSVGLPIIGGTVKIADPDENGEGEICYKGPNVMLGYFKNEEATRAVIDADGFFHTGDYGKIEEEFNKYSGKNDSWLYITGRIKNLIIFSNGKNVYPEEIETEISGVYGVGEVVVYAGQSKSDPTKEIIVAEIYPDADALALHNITDAQKYFEEAVAQINRTAAPYKKVGMVRLRAAEFPKNTSRKIIRFAIDKTID